MKKHCWPLLGLICIAILSCTHRPARSIASLPANDCLSLLSQFSMPKHTISELYFKLFASKRSKQFDRMIFVQKKSEYETLLRNGTTPIMPSDFESRLALIEAFHDINSITPNKSYLTFLKENRTHRLKKIEALFTRHQDKRFFDIYRTRSFWEQFYELYYYFDEGLISFIKKNKQEILGNYLQGQIEKKVVTDGFIKTFSSLQIKDQKTTFSHLSSFFNHPIYKSINMALTDSALLYAHLPPIYFAKFNLQISSEIGQLVIREGFDAAWPTIQKELGLKGTIQIYYQLFRLYYTPVATAAFVALASYQEIYQKEHALQDYLDQLTEQMDQYEKQSEEIESTPTSIRIFEMAWERALKNNEPITSEKIDEWMRALKLTKEELLPYLDESIKAEFLYLISTN